MKLVTEIKTGEKFAAKILSKQKMKETKKQVSLQLVRNELIFELEIRIHREGHL